MDPAPPAAVESVDDFGLPPGHCCPMEEIHSPWSEEGYADEYSWDDESSYENEFSDSTPASPESELVDAVGQDSLQATSDEADEAATPDTTAGEDEYGYGEYGYGGCPCHDYGCHGYGYESFTSETNEYDEYSYEEMSGERAETADEATEAQDDAVAAVEQSAEESEACEDECMYEDEYMYDSEDAYSYEEMSGEQAETADEAAETQDDAVAAVEQSAEESEACEDECMYEDEYMYGYEDAYGEEGQVSEPQDISDEQPADQAAEDSTSDSSYDSYNYAEYESMYGYGYDCGAAMEQVETIEEAQPADEAQVVEEPVADEAPVADETASDEAWDYGDESDYGTYDYEMESSLDNSSEVENADEAAIEEDSYGVYDDEMMYDPSDAGEASEPADESEVDENDVESGAMEQTDAIDESASVETQPYECDEWAYDYGEYVGCDDATAEATASEAGGEVAEIEQPAEADTTGECGEWVDDCDADDYGTDEVSAYESAEAAEAYGSAQDAGDVVSDYDEFGYETSYSEFSYETADEESAADESMAEESATDETATDESEPTVRYECWNGYQYEYYYPEAERGMSDEATEKVDAAVESEDEAAEPAAESAEPANDGVGRYDYADPYAYYGYDYPSEGDSSWQAQTAEEPVAVETASGSGLELFGWAPDELLSWSDQELVRTLDTLSDQPTDVRRAALNDHLYSLGTEAQEFASQFEQTTGIDVLGLSNDLPSTAALLATYRLIERGELGVSEGVDLLRRSLADLSPQWIDNVRAMTDSTFEDWDGGFTHVEAGEGSAPADSKAVVDAMIALTVHSLSGMGGAVLDLSHTLVGLDWESVVLGSSDREASHASVDNDSVQR